MKIPKHVDIVLIIVFSSYWKAVELMKRDRIIETMLTFFCYWATKKKLFEFELNL